MGAAQANVSGIFAKRRITEESHLQFAELSGDLNPLHVDSEAAKSMPPGQRLAYGMDMLLWALEILETHSQLAEQLVRVRVRFTKWVFLEDEVELRQSATPKEYSFELVVDGEVVAAFTFLSGERKPAASLECANTPLQRRNEPNALLFEQLEGHQGHVPVANSATAAKMFPALAKRFGPEWVSECATCSYIIGMEAPGLYSMSMKYDLEFCAKPAASTCMYFKVVAADERFRKIRIGVQGAAISATLEAMVREP